MAVCGCGARAHSLGLTATLTARALAWRRRLAALAAIRVADISRLVCFLAAAVVCGFWGAREQRATVDGVAG